MQITKPLLPIFQIFKIRSSKPNFAQNQYYYIIVPFVLNSKHYPVLLQFYTNNSGPPKVVTTICFIIFERLNFGSIFSPISLYYIMCKYAPIFLCMQNAYFTPVLFQIKTMGIRDYGLGRYIARGV